MARKKRLSKEKILQVSHELLTEKGVEALDIRSIAKALDVAVGTVYNYYKSQEELILELFQYSWTKTKERIEQSEFDKYVGFEKYKYVLEIIFEDVENRNAIGKYIIGDLSKYSLDEKNSKWLLIKDALKTYTDSAFEDINKENQRSKAMLELDKEMLFQVTAMSFKKNKEERELFLQWVEEKFFNNL